MTQSNSYIVIFYIKIYFKMPNPSFFLQQIRALEKNLDHREYDRKVAKVVGRRGYTVYDDNYI